MLVSPSYAIALLQVCNTGTNCFDDANPFVADALVCLPVMKICAAKPGSSDFDKDLVALEVGPRGLGFVDFATLLAFEDYERRHHT